MIEVLGFIISIFWFFWVVFSYLLAYVLIPGFFIFTIYWIFHELDHWIRYH